MSGFQGTMFVHVLFCLCHSEIASVLWNSTIHIKYAVCQISWDLSIKHCSICEVRKTHTNIALWLSEFVFNKTDVHVYWANYNLYFGKLCSNSIGNARISLVCCVDSVPEGDWQIGKRKQRPEEAAATERVTVWWQEEGHEGLSIIKYYLA